MKLTHSRSWTTMIVSPVSSAPAALRAGRPVQHRRAVEVAADAGHGHPGHRLDLVVEQLDPRRAAPHPLLVRARDVDAARRTRPRCRRWRRRSAGATCRSRRCRRARCDPLPGGVVEDGTQSHSTLPPGVCTSSARCPIATGGSTPTPSRSGSSSRSSLAWSPAARPSSSSAGRPTRRTAARRGRCRTRRAAARCPRAAPRRSHRSTPACRLPPSGPDS